MSLLIACSINGLQLEGTQFVCAGDQLNYNCSIMGGTATLWTGSAFNCPQDGSEITLRHRLFASNQALGICNNGDITGHGIRVDNDCFTSQLSVTVSGSFDNKTVQCAIISNEGTRTIGESLLSVASGRYAVSCYHCSLALCLVI